MQHHARQIILSSLMATGAVVATGLPQQAAAQATAQASFDFDLPAQGMDDALRAVARKAGIELFFEPGDVAGLMAPALSGRMNAAAALNGLLRGSRLTLDYANGAYFVRRKGSARRSAAADGEGETVVVTGTHIRGAAPASLVTTVTQKDMRNAGHSNLGDAARALPQNFSGGQNPGVGFTQGAFTNYNTNGASSLNLRGLGTDATLTLLNGHRLSYDAAFQGIDISAIPFIAVERMEVVADGASAMYGSDAVGGVANVILKRDYQGVSAAAKLGASTNGGNEVQQYSAVGGTRWEGGGVMLAYDFERSSRVTARQRSYTAALDDSSAIFPRQKRHALTLAAHQALGDHAALSIDALYNSRRSQRSSAMSKGVSYLVTGYEYRPQVESLTVAPALTFDLSSNWRAGLSFVYGRDRSHQYVLYRSNGAITRNSVNCYCNQMLSAEATLEGRLFALPGGDARLAAGGGYRVNKMHYTASVNGTPQAGLFDAKAQSYYGYGELYLPLLSPDQQIAVVHRLTATAALRYEDYPGVDRIATPKLGLIYVPVEGLELKGSWGKSFKAPTLYQQHIQTQALLLSTASYGSLFPAGSAMIYASGGNAALKPERATSWSVTATLAPPTIDGLRIDISYYDVDYRDRAVQPINSTVGMLTNPLYADLISFNPSAAAQSAAFADAAFGLENYSGRPYSPASVVALVDNRYRNVARQAVNGIDLALRYAVQPSDRDRLTFSASGTWLKSRQQLSPQQPDIDLAGTIFNPPHLRARAMLSWERDGITVSPSIDHVGSVADRRTAAATRVRALTSVNLTARLTLKPQTPLFGAMEIGLDLLNILNAKPEVIRTTNAAETPFDSTNYSAVGRFVALSLSKHF